MTITAEEELELATQVERLEKQSKANQTRKIRDLLVNTFLIDAPERKEPSLDEIKAIIKLLDKEAHDFDKI
jgi:hypothetical protein